MPTETITKKKPAPKVYTDFNESLIANFKYLLKDSRLTVCKIIGFRKNQGYGGSFSFNLLICLEPEVRLINYNFNENAFGTKFDRKFDLPLPYRYLNVSLNYNHNFKSLSGKVNHLTFSATNLHSKDVNINKQIGSFLSNCRPFDYGDSIFCAAWDYNKTYKELTEAAITEAVYSILENYYWSSYNNHWYRSCYRSPSLFMLIRDLGEGIDFQSPLFQKLYKEAKDSKISTLSEYTKSEYWNLVKGYGGQTNNADRLEVTDYYAILDALQDTPNYWINLDPLNTIVAPVSDSGVYWRTDSIPINQKKPKEFIDKLTTLVGVK